MEDYEKITFTEAKDYIQNELSDKQLNAATLIKTKLCLSKNNKQYKIIYTPFEKLNHNAKIMMVGITPGETQLINAYKAIKNGQAKTSLEAKRIGAFSGKLNEVLIGSLNSIWPKRKELFGVKDCKELFTEKNDIVHSTSLLKDAVFEKASKKNSSSDYVKFKDAYKIFKSDLLLEELNRYFIKECNTLSESIPIICLGDGVFNVVTKLKEEEIIKQDKIIFIPHPSFHQQLAFLL